jgi:hypothetical protein
MNQVIAVIGQYPFGICETFHAHWTLAALVELTADLLSDGLNLFGIATGADYKEIGEGGDIAQIQYADIGRFIRFSGTGGGKPRRGRERFCEFLSGGAA